MLVLSRKAKENIVLRIKNKDGTEKEVVIKFLEVGARKTRVGFESDPEVIIIREELLKKHPKVSSVVKEVVQI